MNNITSNDLVKRIKDILPHVQGLVSQQGLDEFERRAFSYIVDRLHQIEQECIAGQFSQEPTRKGEIARIASETNPQILRPELGGELIEIEAFYYAL